MKLIENVDVAGKVVFVRVDLDVPLENGKVVDDSRIKDSFKTINYLVEQNAKVVVGGHLGRPEGKVVKELSLDVLVKLFADQFPNFTKLDDCVGTKVVSAVGAMSVGEVVLLENLRFNAGEKDNSVEFAQQLADLVEIYVNDCFATSHREHASLDALPRLLPSYAGLDVAEEVKNLSKVLKNPARPVILVLGGNKLKTKLPLVEDLAKVADKVLLGSKLASVYTDVNPKVIISSNEVDGKDIDTKTIEKYTEIIAKAGTVVWNGPVGVWEEEKHMKGTLGIAEAVADSDAFSVVGGGDTIAAVNQLGFADKFDFVSSGGGAMLTFLARKEMPGLNVLDS